MNKNIIFTSILLALVAYVSADDVLGCGGFIKSHVPIDFSKVLVKLYTKQGILKDQTNCAPNNGYYFIPLYDKGDYVLQLQPPPGWSFHPTKVTLQINGKTDICSQGKDINFTFKGFGITGKVESVGSSDGPSLIDVELISNSEIRRTITGENGVFFFTPVFPGNYVLTISHPKWKLIKNSISVKVTEGNTEISPNSLVVGGYDITGSIKSDGVPITGANIVLYAEAENKYALVDGCEKTAIPNYKNEKFLCHTLSDTNGNFIFPSISNGNYYIVPFYKGQTIHFEPDKIKFTISHNSMILPETFEIVGFSVGGRVLNAPNGEPLEGAEISLNGKVVGATKVDGSYYLEKIKAGIYSIEVSAKEYQFEPQIMKVNPSLTQLPNIHPRSYKVCGRVVSDKMESVLISLTKIGSTTHVTTNSDSRTGEFCEYLVPGKYQVQVNVAHGQSLQFFPIMQTIEVMSSPVYDITFSQLKATINGKIECQNMAECANLKVIFKPTTETSEQYIASIVDGRYMITDMRPGSYRVTLSTNNYCWKDDEFPITISSTVFTVPTFVQNGYSVTFISSHDTKITYKSSETKTEVIPVIKGTSKHCVQKAGSYAFNLDSCHTYQSNVINYNTDQQTNDILISAKKHRTTLAIEASENFGNINVAISIDGVKNLYGPYTYSNNQYIMELFLSPGETAILVPQSDILYFNPPILSINGEDDCIDLGIKFEAKKGRVFKGKINPPLQGVQITVESENSDTLMDESDADGNYKFPPLDDSKSYKIVAKKDSYVLLGPDENGNFLAHKLAEILVDVVDEKDNKPLQGALLSLSGGESYRSNLQTNEDGKITFPSLSPSEYFLKPMMKEYSFDPPSKIINVQVGASVKVQLKGKRVAYSAYGQVTSLNHQPEEKMIIVAAGNNNCSEYSEEATSEKNGYFRIRGLLPYCSYDIKVKGSLDERESIERAAPSEIVIQSINKDINGLHMIVFRPAPNTDVLVKVYTENPDHYKNLRVKVARESAPAGLVHTVKIDTSSYKITKDNNVGILVQIPSVPLDGKMYSIQLESSLSSLNKGKPQIKFFTTDSSFKFINLDFIVKSNQAEQHIKQTSIWTLAFIFGTMLAAYNIEKVVQMIKFKIPLNNVDTLWKPKPVTNDFTPDNNDIDQIVENINATKRKVKSKRI